MEFWPMCEPRFVGYQCACCDVYLEARDEIAYDADASPVLMHWHCYEQLRHAYFRGLSHAAMRVLRYGDVELAESMMADLEGHRTRLARAKTYTRVDGQPDSQVALPQHATR